jgi:hypothetical protein
MSARIEVLLWANRVLSRRATAQPHELLEVKPDASLDDLQAAFHKVAKLAHPDLHRGLDAEDLEKVTSAYGQVANAYQTLRATKLRGGHHQPGSSPAIAVPIPAGPGGTKAPSGEIPRAKRPSDQTPVVRLPGGALIRGSKPTRSPPFDSTRTKLPTQPPPAQTAPPPRANPRPGTQPPAVGSSPAVVPPSDNPGAPLSPAQQMSSKALIYYRKAELALRQGNLQAATLNLKMAIAADPHSTFLRSALSEVEQELKNR